LPLQTAYVTPVCIAAVDLPRVEIHVIPLYLALKKYQLMKTTLLLSLGFSVFQHLLYAQCEPAPGTIHAFTFDGRAYEIIRENKSWEDASACAVARGGKLAEINSQAEQDALFLEANAAGITLANTVAADGDASYLWIGGNDLATEGNWVWNGDHDQTSEPFWIGDFNGSPVGAMYNNWGDEPDDAGGQDGLGLALSDWPFGVAGEWNDVDVSNALYYIVEYGSTASVPEMSTDHVFSVYPNPTNTSLTVLFPVPGNARIEIFSIAGELLLFTETQMVIDLSTLPGGTYMLRVIQGSNSYNQLIVKQ
jgi:hypothetical protein